MNAGGRHRFGGPHSVRREAFFPRHSGPTLTAMKVHLDNVGIAVRDLNEAIDYFSALGLRVVGRDTVSGGWSDEAVDLDGNHAMLAVLATPDGHGRVELFQYLHPQAIETRPTRPNDIGMHRLGFRVADLEAALAAIAKLGHRPLRGIANYQDVYKLCYVTGPSNIIVMLAQEC